VDSTILFAIQQRAIVVSTQKAAGFY
jgi:hypothetical protein